MTASLRIEPVDVRRAAPETYAAINAFMNEIRAERLPDDPPLPLDEETQRLRTIPPFIDIFFWTVVDEAGIVAYASTTIFRTPDNPHLVDFTIAVRRSRRRRGIGTRLLEHVAEATAREGRSLLVTDSRSTVPDAEGFLRRIGAQVGLEGHTNQLDLRDLDRSLLARWQAAARGRAAGFELLAWEGDYPEEHVEAFARVVEAMNSAPRGALRVQDFHVTPDHLREWSRAARERGQERWTIVARERSTGRFAGFTEVYWHPNRPEILSQEGTGVLPEFQNRGLGRWLKAAMLAKVLRERPQVTKVRTGNADMNAPMLKINRELGFRPYISQRVWQVELPQVQAYLDSVRDTKLAALPGR
ncbi:MAG TPA: GNAT family N-acetyltransferase [bacterium]|nr:GNAT family N-acetyltransferase [bacterium]